MTTDTDAAMKARDIAGELWEAAIRCDFDAFKIEVANALAHTASAQKEAVRVTDAARYRWLKENRPVLLVTGFFGNGCINRTITEVDSAIDAAIAKDSK